MKTYKYLLVPIIFLLTSCYIYKPYSEKTEEQIAKQSENSPLTAKSIRNEKSSDQANERVRIQQGNQSMNSEQDEKKTQKEQQKLEQEKGQQQSNSSFTNSDGTVTASSKNANKGENINNEETKPKELGIKGKLEPNKYYKINALGNQYKIQVDKWEGDTLISHKIRQPKKVYKHHMNDIEEEAILERRFSKPFSDLLTVGAYASGAAIVLLLVL